MLLDIDDAIMIGRTLGADKWYAQRRLNGEVSLRTPLSTVKNHNLDVRSRRNTL
jgi:hypothetical protein